MINKNYDKLENLLKNSSDACKFFYELEEKIQISLKENSDKIHNIDDLINYANFIMHEFN